MKNRFYRDKKWLEKKYCKEKLSVIEIAEICEVRKRTIYDWIYKFDLIREKVFPRRSKSRYSLNEKYFEKIDSSNKAYWLGFIAADGCVVNEKGRRVFFIELSRKDRKHIEKFKKEIDYEGPIYDLERNGRGFLSSKLQICSCSLVQDLVNWGIVQNKTKFLQKPNILKKYYSDWIRGYFDGDGTVSLSRNQLRGKFFSSSLDVIEFIAENMPGTAKILKENVCNGYSYAFGGNNLSSKIYDFLYKKDCICLERKKNKFLLKVKEK